jgi:hypothetical protein
MNDLADILGAIGTNASQMLLSFFGGSVSTDAKREGTKRRVRREDATRAAVSALYATTPALPPTRQMIRAERRAIAKEVTTVKFTRNGKKLRKTNWNWREVFLALSAPLQSETQANA